MNKSSIINLVKIPKVRSLLVVQNSDPLSIAYEQLLIIIGYL